ncbi:hypothetical protein Tco_0010771 [Tanacetum coccineum]
MEICHAKTYTLRGKVFDETRAEVRLSQIKTHVLPLCQSFPQELGNLAFTPRTIRSPSKPDRVHICIISGVIYEREIPPLCFSILTPIPSPNANELPPIIVFTFTAGTPENTLLTNHASTLANLAPMISPTFVEANHGVLKSLLREQRRKKRNEYLRIELDYFSEEHDEEREMEPRPV